MALKRLGIEFSLHLAAIKNIELGVLLSGLDISSNLLESTILKPAIALDYHNTQFELGQIAYDLQYIYFFEKNKWNRTKDFTVSITRLYLSEYLTSNGIAIPHDLFEDTFYEDGEYDYELYLVRSDKRSYTDIVLTTSSVMSNSSIMFLFSINGIDWEPELTIPQLVSKVYMKICIVNILMSQKVIPTEFISINCLVSA